MNPLWRPKPEQIESANVTRFARRIQERHGMTFADHDALHRWSVAEPEKFWKEVWDFCGVQGDPGSRVLLDPEKMPGARFFPDATLNFAQNLLRKDGDGDALVFWGEDKVKRRISHKELRREVAGFAAALLELGVAPGDRVAAYMPNIPETIIAMLGAASIGATFTSASPDFGVQGVLDRFGQTQPKVLVATDSYYYNGKRIDVVAKLAEIAPKLPTLSRIVVVPYLPHSSDLSRFPNAVEYEDFVAAYRDSNLNFAQLPFNHPLYILYSSGTTGVPKCIVHGAGGTLIEHLKELVLHTDVKAGDRFFYFTTCGWMMWNWMVSGLAAEATLLLYDGSPFVNDGRILWDYAEAEGITHFGTSAKYIDALAKKGLKPRETHDLSKMRAILSTGSPLVAESFDYVYRDIKPDVQLASIAGGTDIVACFVQGSPTLPLWRGEIQCKGLGMAVAVFDENGNSLKEQKGELVCTQAFPSMPVGFWNDSDGKKYRAAYFERFPGVWHHGDYCEITGHDGIVIYGRSDATLNPGGVRIGTAEIYRQVETLPEVTEAIVIGQSWPPGSGDVRVVLFVKLRDGLALDDALVKRIKQRIRANTTPRHVPEKVLQVADIPRTKSGKIVELAVRNVVHGEPVQNIEALANPEALTHFRDRAELQA
ncbi:MAG: acetoacetate--CoA ligase [Burkholderiales bacterium]